MEIIVVSRPDGWDTDLFFAGLFRIGEIDVSSVADLVNKVSAASSAGGELVTRLNILGHGSPDSMSVGNDEVMIANLARFYPTLRTLWYSFDDSAFVHLQQCDTGSNQVLMQRLAQAFRVTVYAGTGDEHPVARYNDGGVCLRLPGWLIRTDRESSLTEAAGNKLGSGTRQQSESNQRRCVGRWFRKLREN